MSTLEVLQSCPTQRKILLTTLGALDPDNTNLIHFNVKNYNSRLPHKLAFQIIMKVVEKKFFRIVLDEGASTSVLSLSCWKAIGSPKLVTSPMTLKAFDGSGFHPHGLIPALSIELGGKTISIHVEVVDAPLDYNLLLGINWFYAMTVVASTVFRTVQFLHLGMIVTNDWLDFCMPYVTTPMANNIPMLGQSPSPYQSIAVGMLKDSSLMGIF